MNKSIEIEKTYLVKNFPIDIFSSNYIQIIDIYIPDDEISTIRLRQKGNNFEITKKIPIKKGNASSHIEYTIPLSESEFNIFKKISKKTVSKKRYKFLYKKYNAELDVFDDNLKGLVLIDFEFHSNSEFDNFIMPDYCLADVTEEDFIAGKNLAGKNIEQIKDNLDKFNYKLLI